MCILPIDNFKTLWYNRPARERTWRAEFLSIGRFNKFLGQIFVQSVNRQNPESVLYYNHSKGRKTYQTGKVNYKSGWQVATNGVECKTAREAINAVKDFGGNCGVWLANGIYYVDKSKRVQTKKQALEIGKACNQISVYGWARGNLAYC